jgi:hypothetical protein
VRGEMLMLYLIPKRAKFLLQLPPSIALVVPPKFRHILKDDIARQVMLDNSQYVLK